MIITRILKQHTQLMINIIEEVMVSVAVGEKKKAKKLNYKTN